MQRTRNSCGTTSVYRITRPHGILTDPQAVSGPTRLCLLRFSKATPKGIPYPVLTALQQPAALWQNAYGMYWFSSPC